jgi:uncharacterized protein YndB with AHSA1/START domain
MHLEASEVINRSVDELFRWYADDHVRNHPRWNPDLELERTSDDPLDVGSVIRRRNRMSGTPVEGTMEVVEFERNRAMGVIIHEGPVETRGRATFEPQGDQTTLLTISADMPDLDDPMRSRIAGLMERSVRNIKHLIEAET